MRNVDRWGVGWAAWGPRPYELGIWTAGQHERQARPGRSRLQAGLSHSTGQAGPGFRPDQVEGQVGLGFLEGQARPDIYQNIIV